MTIACIGECMIELSEGPAGHLTRGFGGDTLNTAVYLARLGCRVDYLTALGDDPFSDAMIAAWAAEGVGTAQVRRVPGRLPGLYLIETGASGERRFYHWRDSSAARTLFDGDAGATIAASLRAHELVYLSGITLSLYGTEGRARLMEGLREAQRAGTRIAFDTNYRPRNWRDAGEARGAFSQLGRICDILLASDEDLALLGGEAYDLLTRTSAAEVVLKQDGARCRILAAGEDAIISGTPLPDAVDTTAAGDSFAAAYLAARQSGAGPAEAAAAGHRLAGRVVQHRGAIIPRIAMADLMPQSAIPQEASA